MPSLTRHLLVSAVLTGSALACGAGEDDASSGDSAATAGQIQGAFDVDDVSILFPMKGNAPYPEIRVSGIAAPGQDQAPAAEQLWPVDIWNQVIAEAVKRKIASGESGNADFFKLRGLWHVAALRFDPCAPGLDDAVLNAATIPAEQRGKCLIQLRLIAQPFTGTSTSASDFAAHLVFNLGAVPKSQLAQNQVVLGATKMLSAIKDASSRARALTTGRTLGVHPGLEAEAKSGGNEIAGLVTALIKQFTNTPSRAIAFMGLQNGGPEPWTFFAGQVVNGKYVATPGPAHGQLQQTLSFAGGDGPVLQKSQNPVNTSSLFTADPDKMTADQRAIPFKVENPKTQHFFNTDCISCHSSSSRIADLGLGDKAEISSRVGVPANITGYVAKTEAQDDIWNVHNFGYFGNKPTVSGRTAAETVAIVQWMNQNVVVPGSGINGGARDCSSVDAVVWKCFRDGKANCLAQCKAAPQPTNDSAPNTVPASVASATGNGGTGDPCVDHTVGGASTISVTNTQLVSGTALNATLGGNDAACFAKLFGGAFISNTNPAIVVICPSSAACALSVGMAPGQNAGSAGIALDQNESARFQQFFRFLAGSFATHATNGGAEVSCANGTCRVDIATDAANLPDVQAAPRINP